MVCWRDCTLVIISPTDNAVLSSPSAPSKGISVVISSAPSIGKHSLDLDLEAGMSRLTLHVPLSTPHPDKLRTGRNDNIGPLDILQHGRHVNLIFRLGALGVFLFFQVHRPHSSSGSWMCPLPLVRVTDHQTMLTISPRSRLKRSPSTLSAQIIASRVGQLRVMISSTSE